MTRPSELLFTEVSIKNKIGVLDLPNFRQMKQGTKCTRSHDIYVSFSPLQLKLRGIQPSRSLQVFKDFNLFNMAASRANVTLLYISSYFIHLAVFTCHLGTVLFFFRFGLLRNLKI